MCRAAPRHRLGRAGSLHRLTEEEIPLERATTATTALAPPPIPPPGNQVCPEEDVS